MTSDALRRKVLEEWRGLPESRSRDRTIEVGRSIDQLVNKLGLTERICENDILHAWREIVGDFLATHSAPVRLAEGMLHVQVLQPTVRYELDRTWKPEILRKLQQRFGKKLVRDIRFKI